MDQITHAVRELYEQAAEEICVLLRYPSLMSIGRERLQALLKRGVRIRMITERAFFVDEQIAPDYLRYADQTGHLRWREQVPVRMVLLDKRIYLLPLEDSDSSPALLIVPNALVSEGMHAVFQELWEASGDMDDLPNSDSDPS